MNKLVPLSKFSKKAQKIVSSSGMQVYIDETGAPLGFVFGKNSFIDFLERMDSEFQKQNTREGYNNPAGKLIDLIEEHLQLNPQFVKELKDSVLKKQELIPLEDVARAIHR